MNEQLKNTINGFLDAFEFLSEERRELLEQGSGFITSRLESGLPPNLTFICTHNSRRSHLAQAWCQVAAFHYSLPGVSAFSGGIEATACNPRTICALERCGFEVEIADKGTNPFYKARAGRGHPEILLYSKIYDASENPQSGFAAMMCCSDVDEKCPLVTGAELRLPLHYRDPKESDNTDQEAEIYDRRCREIGIEMFYMLSRV